MTPQIAALTIHDDALEASFLGTDGGTLIALPTARAEAADAPRISLPWRLRREARHRRLLGVADLLAALLAVTIAVNAGPGRTLALLGLPLVVVLFKIAGLYDRDQVRLAHSTVDELPTLLQITGLFTLGLTILVPALEAGPLRPSQIAMLWLSSFVATVGARACARWTADRISGAERCLVVGEQQLAERIRDKVATSGARASVVATLP